VESALLKAIVNHQRAGKSMNTPHKFLNLKYIVTVAFAFSLATVLLAQQSTDSKTDSKSESRKLVVNGKAISAPVRRIDGRSYVELEGLAQATNGTLTFGDNQIILTIPAANAARPATASAQAGPAPVAPQNRDRLSREFASSANLAVSDMREWKGAMATMVAYGRAVEGNWATEYRNRVTADVTQASVAAITDGDRNALGLLNSQFSNLSNWASAILSERQAMDGARTVDPSSLASDQTLQRITDCNRFLNSMLVSGTFSDDAVCH
jgi:hypothetical protein